jgi:hypothetical protein
VEPRDVGLRRDEEPRRTSRPEEAYGQRPLGVGADLVDARAGEGRELGDDRVDLAGGERQARARKCCGRPEAAAALDSRGAEPYFLLFFFAAVFFFAAGFFVAFFFAAIGAPSSERPFDSGRTP